MTSNSAGTPALRSTPWVRFEIAYRPAGPGSTRVLPDPYKPAPASETSTICVPASRGVIENWCDPVSPGPYV
ncbi:MAG: hypothetical protein DMF81_14160 [Acidobacteria bacterium]|nr:MAG: hypothetical protein DMF81_14160 [Acidobacteriota bacterium]